MTGATLQRTIADLLFYDNWLVFRINQGGLKDENTGQYVRFAYWSLLGHAYEREDGISDLLALKTIDGRLTALAIEVKGKGDRVRPSQVDFLAAVAAVGAVAIVAKGVEDIEAYLSERLEVQ